MLVILFLVGGPILVKRFVRGYFRGVDIYVFLTVDGQTVAYKNPKEVLGQEDKPLEMVPHALLYSNQYETYYNICWFDCGTLYRCGHSFHRTQESALYCERTKSHGLLIGTVLEER